MVEISRGVATVNGIHMHYRRAGSGSALVLLHGWPQTGYCWRRVLPALAERHTVIAPDLRGYGHTDKPTTGYDKRTMAADVAALLESLGFDTAAVVGHDRGARVAHRWALDRPDQVTKLAVLDIIPTRETWRRMDAALGRRFFHWFFHLQPDLPERLVGHDISGYLRYFFETWTVNRHGLPGEAIDEYIRAFSTPGALRAGFDDYRAAELDTEHDNADAGHRLRMPVLALWGAASFLEEIPALEIWREYAENVTGAAIPECGHFLAEERPQALLAHLTEFLAA
ncbi:alpha/beta fold hydrolase [Nocardia brasiliensis]|uniref:alpha/beta fold hydrolase n=1 Tax=Nocardia brasiliensis TaxID=37326 RepID=UPI0004A7125D|nr:alpha/beta hydrolase [Nocardia brasiliensis]